MIKVWILMLMSTSGGHSVHTAIVDNLATKEDCQRVATSFRSFEFGRQEAKCVQVWKMKP